MQCHKCRYDERNGGTLEERKLHCPKCELSEVYVKPGFPVGDSLTDALIEKESMFRYDHESGGAEEDGGEDLPDCKDSTDSTGNADKLDSEMAILAKSDFLKHFCRLHWRCQQIVLHILNGKCDNRAIHESSGMSVSTLVSWRRKMANEPFWNKFLDRVRAKQRTRRKRTTKPPPSRTHDCYGIFRDRAQVLDRREAVCNP